MRMPDSTPEDFLHLHARSRVAADGAPALTERFVTHLEAQVRGAEVADDTGPRLSLDRAWRRLLAEYPVEAETLDLCGRQGLTERAAAAQLGISPTLAHRRKAAGLGKLALWTRCDAALIRVLLPHV